MKYSPLRQFGTGGRRRHFRFHRREEGDKTLCVSLPLDQNISFLHTDSQVINQAVLWNAIASCGSDGADQGKHVTFHISYIKSMRIRYFALFISYSPGYSFTLYCVMWCVRDKHGHGFSTLAQQLHLKAVLLFAWAVPIGPELNVPSQRSWGRVVRDQK